MAPALYEKFIDEHPFLVEYFEEFPKQLMLLAYEGEVAKFCGNDIVIDMNRLTHLLSSESPFRIESIRDFFESMHITGFQRANQFEKSEKNHLCMRFNHPLCIPGQPIRDDLYKISVERDSKVLRGMKRLTTCSIGLVQRLLRYDSRRLVKMSKLQLAHLRLQFALQKQKDSSNRKEPDVIDFSIEDTDYAGGEIAGYYGNVSEAELRAAFQNYLPLYQNIDEQITQEPTSIQHQISIETTGDSPEYKEIAPEPKKKKKNSYSKKSREAVKESEEAVMFLKKNES